MGGWSGCAISITIAMTIAWTRAMTIAMTKAIGIASRHGFGICSGSCHSERWLGPRESTIFRCVEQDLTQRDLAESDRLRNIVHDVDSSFFRILLADLLHRGLYLHRFAMKYSHIMHPDARTTPRALIEQAQENIKKNKKKIKKKTKNKIKNKKID